MFDCSHLVLNHRLAYGPVIIKCFRFMLVPHLRIGTIKCAGFAFHQSYIIFALIIHDCKGSVHKLPGKLQDPETSNRNPPNRR